MNRLTQIITDIILNNKPLTPDDAHYLVSGEVDIWNLLSGANTLRQHFKGNKISLCSIINAKSGNCSEDCKFCAQSTHHSSEINRYPLVSIGEIRKGYQRAQEIGAHGYSIVTSGNKLSDNEIDTLCEIAGKITAQGGGKPSGRGGTSPNSAPYLCGSLGRLTPSDITKLKKSGFTKLHHNLETSRRFFPQICTTHPYDERIQTIRNLKKAGMKVCSGGIFGMGETWSDRIEMAFTLKELEVDSIPLNFLIPVKGTGLENTTPLAPLEILKIIALYRYILPAQNIRVCAGREHNLRDLQSWIFYAGADGMMIGGYLTQPGRPPHQDIQMIKDLGVTV